jgi:hypothetical protein
MMMFTLSSKRFNKEFLTAYYRDELKAKGLDPDYDVRLGDDYGKRNPTYYNS